MRILESSIGRARRRVREAYITLRQRIHLHLRRAGRRRRMIVFLVPGRDFVNGGVMSIISLADETARLRAIHGADVFVATVPGTPRLLRYTKFANRRTLVGLDLLLNRVPPDAELLIHVPEVHVENLVQHEATTLARLGRVTVRFNILLQNIDLIPRPGDVARLKSYGATTCTTAHRAYGNSRTADRIGCDVHHLSVWISPEQYRRVPFAAKRDLIAISPDLHPARDRVLEEMRLRLPKYELREVRNLSFEQYKKLVGSAKFSLTFGEGLDGYFIETVFSGGIGCAVFDERFFTSEFIDLPFVYPCWEALVRQLPADIALADSEGEFQKIQSSQFERLATEYSFARYRANLEKFYLDYFPARR